LEKKGRQHQSKVKEKLNEREKIRVRVKAHLGTRGKKKRADEKRILEPVLVIGGVGKRLGVHKPSGKEQTVQGEAKSTAPLKTKERNYFKCERSLCRRIELLAVPVGEIKYQDSGWESKKAKEKKTEYQAPGLGGKKHQDSKEVKV